MTHPVDLENSSFITISVWLNRFSESNSLRSPGRRSIWNLCHGAVTLSLPSDFVRFHHNFSEDHRWE